eukprot:4080813-Prymnesium_polylepis.1
MIAGGTTTCQQLESANGCDCTGCSCVHLSPPPTMTMGSSTTPSLKPPPPAVSPPHGLAVFGAVMLVSVLGWVKWKRLRAKQ